MAKRLAEKLAEVGAPGYTLIDQASGLGDRGVRRGDDPTGGSTNCVFIVACETQESADNVIEGIRPMLTRSGGICLVSDAFWVRH